MLLSRAGTKEYFQRHDVDRLIEDIVFEITLNQPSNPKRHIYEFLGRALGIPQDADKKSVSESKVCSLRMFLEFHSAQGPQIIERHFHRSSSVNEFSEAVLKSWHLDAISCLSDALSNERKIATPKNMIKAEKGMPCDYFLVENGLHDEQKNRWRHSFSGNGNYGTSATFAPVFTDNICQRCL